MRPLRAFATILALFVPLAAHAGAPDARASKPVTGRIVTLTAVEITRLGLQVTALKSASFTPRVHGYGAVVDLTALAQTDSGFLTARAAVTQSQADVKRYRTLFAQDNAISRQLLDTSEKQAATDQAQLLLAERNEFVQFGQQAPWLGKHPDRSLLQQLTSGSAVLVKATFPLDTLGAAHPTEISVSHLSAQQDQQGWTTRQVWSAPADPTIPGRSLFALIHGSNLQSGEHALVYAPVGPTIPGIEVPGNAVIFSEGKPWCYLQIVPGSFQRMQIDLSRPLAGGYFVSAQPGGFVVVRGTGLLLARELGAAMMLRY
jgi:hypothetical protein